VHLSVARRFLKEDMICDMRLELIEALNEVKTIFDKRANLLHRFLFLPQ